MDEFLGIIKLFAGDYAPKGWMICDGRTLSISNNEALFAIIGNRFGGDGRINFALPDLRGRVAVGMGTGTGLSPRNIASTGGKETETLTPAQIPAHTHTLNALSGGTEVNTPKNNYFPEYTNTAAKFYSVRDKGSDVLLAMNPETVASVGGSQAHNNMQPFIALNYIIYVEGGLFPVRE
jgi:microcystin-dependent protein